MLLHHNRHHHHHHCCYHRKNLQGLVASYINEKKGKGFSYLLPSIGSGADPNVQAVSPQVTINHPPSGRLPLLSARPAVTFSAAECHSPLARTQLYGLMTKAHRCEQLAQGCYAAFATSRI